METSRNAETRNHFVHRNSSGAKVEEPGTTLNLEPETLNLELGTCNRNPEPGTLSLLQKLLNYKFCHEGIKVTQRKAIRNIKLSVPLYL